MRWGPVSTGEGTMLGLKCIRLGKQQTPQHQWAADLSIRDSASWRFETGLSDSPAVELTSTAAMQACVTIL